MVSCDGPRSAQLRSPTSWRPTPGLQVPDPGSKSNGCNYPLDLNLTRFEARKTPLMHMMLGPCPPTHKSNGCNYPLDVNLTRFEARKKPLMHTML